VIIFEQVAALWQLVQPRGLREKAVMGSLRVRLLELPSLAANATLMEEGVFARPKGVAKLWPSGLSDPGHASVRTWRHSVLPRAVSVDEMFLEAVAHGSVISWQGHVERGS
jgi:hypothetical protein